MKLKISIEGTQVLMDTKTTEKLFNLLHDCDVVYEHFVGSGQGNTGHANSYVLRTRPFGAQEISVRVLTEDALNAIRSMQETAKD